MLGDSARQSPFMEWNGAELWRRRIHLKCPTSDSNCNEFHAVRSAKKIFHVKNCENHFVEKNRENINTICLLTTLICFTRNFQTIYAAHTVARCLKTTQNVSIQLYNFGIVYQFLSF